MLHCIMSTTAAHTQHCLEELLGDMLHARRNGDMGRLALLAYCEVRRWARQAGETDLAERSADLITRHPHASKEQFLAQIDGLIDALGLAHTRALAQTPPWWAPPPHAHPGALHDATAR